MPASLEILEQWKKSARAPSLSKDSSEKLAEASGPTTNLSSLTRLNLFEEKDGKLIVPLEFVKWISRQRQIVTRHDFDNITITDNGQPIEITEEAKRKFLYTGLSNFYFIENRFWEETANYLDYLD